MDDGRAKAFFLRPVRAIHLLVTALSSSCTSSASPQNFANVECFLHPCRKKEKLKYSDDAMARNVSSILQGKRIPSLACIFASESDVDDLLFGFCFQHALRPVDLLLRLDCILEHPIGYLRV